MPHAQMTGYGAFLFREKQYMSMVLNNIEPSRFSLTEKPCPIIVGSGPVAIRFINELYKHSPEISVKIFGDEPWTPYNRVRLTTLLSGETQQEQLFSSEALPNSENIKPFWNNRIEHINTDNKTVTDSYGDEHAYSKLILAVGSRPRIPSILGVELKNVFTFRNLDDAQALMTRQVKTRRTIVIGGGLLGIEAARAMQRYNTEVTCIEHSTRLMFNQIDDDASNYLENYLESLGIKTEVDARVSRIVGEHKVEGIQLDNGIVIPCDTVILSTGITPNVELARQAGISTPYGIRINDQMESSHADIYAIGECAEHNGKVYGLVAPGFEQAAILANLLAGGKARYHGSTTTSQLKVLDYPVLSIGKNDDSVRKDESYIYEDKENNIYRKLVISRGYLYGAIAVGDWPAKHRIQEAVEHRRLIWPWQKHRFLTEGDLWEEQEAKSVAEWPVNATVCNCTGITRGTLSQAIKAGENTVEKLCKATGASSVCGTCRPLLEDLTQTDDPPPKVKWSNTLFIATIIALLSSLILFLFPAYPYSESLQGLNIDQLWQDNLSKQISGFSLLGLSVLILLLSLRKRLKAFSLGSFPTWRMLHVLLGTGILTAVFIHTGFHLGSQLNFLLMFSFSGLILVGAIASGIISQEHRLPRQLATRLRKTSIWTHLLLFWPIPALLIFHIFKTYYY